MSERDEVDDVLNRLSVLEPGMEDVAPSPSSALAYFKQRSASPITGNAIRKRSIPIMSNRKLVTAGLMLVLAVVLIMGFPSVRAAAGDFLGLFRVQKFAPISVSPQQMALLSQLGEQGLTPGEFVTLAKPGEPVSVGTTDEAAALTGYDLRVLRGPEAPIEVYVNGKASGYLLVNLAGARAIVEAAGADPLLLPDSLDGARVDVQVYDSVQQIYPNGLLLMQTASPDVIYPDDVDPAVLGEALLQVLGTDPAAARQIAQGIDWTSTMLLPIPQDMGTYREVTVDGVSGVALEPFSPDSDPAIVWQKDGMVYMMTGPVFVEDLIEQANQLQ